MIIALSARYRKHIAALLFTVFYMELYASAHARYSEWEDYARYVPAAMQDAHSSAVHVSTNHPGSSSVMPPASPRPAALTSINHQPTTINLFLTLLKNLHVHNHQMPQLSS